MFGKVDKAENQNLSDLNWRERSTLIPIIALCIWIGVYPSPFLDRLTVPVREIMSRIDPDQVVQQPSVPSSTEPETETEPQQPSANGSD